MLFNGERIGDGTPPETDIAVDPIDGTTLTALGPGQRHRRDRRVRAGHDVQPRARASTWRRSPSGPRPRAPSTSTVTGARTSRRSPRPRASRSATSPPSSSTATATSDLIAEVRAAGARIRLIPDGDVAGAISTAWPRLRRRHPLRHRRHARGRHRRRRAQVHGRRDPGPALAPQRRGAGGGRSPPATTSTACSPPTTSCGGDNCFFAATGITDGELLKGVHYDRNGRTTQSLVMRSQSGTVRLINALHRSRSCASSAPSTSSDPAPPGLVPTIEVGGGGEAEAAEVSGGDARLVALVADEHDHPVGVVEALEPRERSGRAAIRACCGRPRPRPAARRRRRAAPPAGCRRRARRSRGAPGSPPVPVGGRSRHVTRRAAGRRRARPQTRRRPFEGCSARPPAPRPSTGASSTIASTSTRSRVTGSHRPISASGGE